MCRSGVDECAFDGGIRRDKVDGVCIDRRIYTWICAPISCTGAVYDKPSGAVKKAYECCKIYGKSRRDTDSFDGTLHVYREDECSHRVLIKSFHSRK